MGIIDSIRDTLAGVRPEQRKQDKGSTAGMLQNRGKYLEYKRSMIEQGLEPLTYAEWAKQ